MTRYKIICNRNIKLYTELNDLAISLIACEAVPDKKRITRDKASGIRRRIRNLKLLIEMNLILLEQLWYRQEKMIQAKNKPGERFTDQHPVILSYLWNEDNSVDEIARKQFISIERVQYIIDSYEKRKLK